MNHPTLYSNAYKEYMLRLQSDYHYALSAYCSEKSISYSGMKNCLHSRGIFVRNLQAEAMAAYSRGDCESASGMSLRQDSFIRFRPVNNASSGTVIKGVSITFPDGVNLSLQERSADASSTRLPAPAGSCTSTSSIISQTFFSLC